jgi:hypothetical protein
MDPDNNAATRGSLDLERSTSALDQTTTTFLPSAIISIPNAYVPPLDDDIEEFQDRKNLNEAPVDTDDGQEEAKESDADPSVQVESETSIPQRPKTAKGGRPGTAKSIEDERGIYMICQCFISRV